MMRDEVRGDVYIRPPSRLLTEWTVREERREVEFAKTIVEIHRDVFNKEDGDRVVRLAPPGGVWIAILDDGV